ncbi:hypothetical protein CXB51_002742 [Gossypium anomalum]|uniref:DUF4283 domain-containing protein n=1 Tax=Gossypium anomalum TaxID=47600 RepID=A0A8J5Z5D6_9ROSI|nr:hypothetical protein CXB51_002742 [Gossypium anomalum]
MEEELASLSLLDEEEVAFQEEEGVIDPSFQFYLWHPIGGIYIIDLGNKRYLFQFFNEVDVQRVISGTPWFFNRKFLDYDTSIPVLGPKTYMHIRVSLGVAAPLKRKKKIQLGHGESYCPFRLKIEPSKIVYGWDLSLRAAPRRRPTVVSRWLREADGSQCHMSNPNLIPLGSNQQYLTNGNKNRCNFGKSALVDDGLVNGLMEMIVEDENDSIAATEGKKRQRVVLGNTTEGGSFDLTASSGEQSSRSQ